MDSKKLVIILIVVVVVLFAISAGIGAGGGLGGDDPQVWVDSLVNSLSGAFPAQPINLNEISASPDSCLDRTTGRIMVPTLGSCTLTFAPSQANTRRLTLQVVPGASVRYRMEVQPVEERSFEIEERLPSAPQPPQPNVTPQPTDRVHLDIYKQGGSLIIDECATDGASQCVINVN